MTCRTKGRCAETIQRSVEPSLADVALDDEKTRRGGKRQPTSEQFP